MDKREKIISNYSIEYWCMLTWRFTLASAPSDHDNKKTNRAYN